MISPVLPVRPRIWIRLSLLLKRAKVGYKPGKLLVEQPDQQASEP